LGLREDKKAATRSQLLKEARALFAERGFDATRVRDIVERVGVSEATFFNYFPTKEALLEDAASETKRFYGAYLQNLRAREEEPVADRVRELLGVIGSVFVADREVLTSVVDRTSLLFGSTGATKELDLANYDLLADLFRQGQVRGEVRRDCDPMQLAEILNATVLLILDNWVSGWWNDAGPLEPRLTLAADVVLHGCVPTDPA
jgi:AcrR family transcriptional regulator